MSNAVVVVVGSSEFATDPRASLEWWYLLVEWGCVWSGSVGRGGGWSCVVGVAP